MPLAPGATHGLSYAASGLGATSPLLTAMGPIGIGAQMLMSMAPWSWGPQGYYDMMANYWANATPEQVANAVRLQNEGFYNQFGFQPEEFVENPTFSTTVYDTPLDIPPGMPSEGIMPVPTQTVVDAAGNYKTIPVAAGAAGAAAVAAGSGGNAGNTESNTSDAGKGNMAFGTNELINLGLPLAKILMGVLGPDPNKWNQNAAIDVLNHLRQTQAGAEKNYFDQWASPLRDELLKTFPLNQYYTSQAPQLFEQLLGFPGVAQSLFGNIQPFSTPETQQAQQGMLQTLMGLGPTANLAAQGFAGGGWTPQYAQAYDTAFRNLVGNNPLMQTQADIGRSLLGARGQDQYSQDLQKMAVGAAGVGGMTGPLSQAQNAALGIIGQGGMNPQLANLFGVGLNTLLGGGYTPAIQAGEGSALAGLNAQGATPFTNLMQGRGLDLALREALLPMGQAVGMAGEQAQDKVLDQFQAAQRLARARGGGPGATVASGLQNRGMAEYADQGAQAVANAMREAMLNQQGLQLQQMATGAGMGQNAATLESQRLKNFADALASLESIASGRFGIGGSLAGQGAQLGIQNLATALGAVPGMQNAGTNLVQALMQGGLGGAQNEIARMGIGGDLLNAFLGTQGNTLNSLSSLMGNQNQYALGLGGLFNQLGGTGLSGYNSLYNNLLQGGQLGYTNANNWVNALLGGQQNQINQLGQLGNYFQNAYGPMTNLANQWLGYARDTLGPQAGVIGGYQPPQNAPMDFTSLQGPLANIFSGNSGSNTQTTFDPKTGYWVTK